MRLRLTRRALEDLSLPVDKYCALDAHEFTDAHDVVSKFVEQRSASPQGQEATALPVTRQTVWNLHSGRWRGLTWHDTDDDVVWLLGVGWHESSSRDDAYAVLKRRDEAGELFPTVEDFEDAEPDDIEAFLEALRETAPALMALAKATPGKEIRGLVAATVNVALLVEVLVVESDKLEETWIAISLPPTPPPEFVLPPEWQTYLLAALLADAAFEDLEWGRDFPRPGGTAANEVVVSWLNG